MGDDSPKLNELPKDIREQFERLLAQLSGLNEFAIQSFTARQGFYEKLILLDGATLTLLFTVIGGLSHSAITKVALVRVGEWLFIGCWLFVMSIMLSLLHNHLNIQTLIHTTGSVKRTTFHWSRFLLRISMQKVDVFPGPDPEAEKELKKGVATENMCRWIGVAAQALTIFGYVALVASLQTVIRALAG